MNLFPLWSLSCDDLIRSSVLCQAVSQSNNPWLAAPEVALIRPWTASLQQKSVTVQTNLPLIWKDELLYNSQRSMQYYVAFFCQTVFAAVPIQQRPKKEKKSFSICVDVRNGFMFLHNMDHQKVLAAPEKTASSGIKKRKCLETKF